MPPRIRILPASDIHRVTHINREELIEAEYVPRLSDDGIAIRLDTWRYDPPRLFEDWDDEGCAIMIIVALSVSDSLSL